MDRRTQLTAYLSLVAVCIFWGTTYAGIRMALESFPPYTLMALRFLLSGGILLAIFAARGAVLPRGRELALTALNGVISLGVGNACLTIAETWVPTGVASILVATSPFWIVGLEALIPGGVPLHLPTVFGMIVGLGGVVMLALPAGDALHVSPQLLSGMAVIQLGCFGWCLGAILKKRLKSQVNPVLVGAIQQFAVGLSFLPIALVQQQPVHPTARGIGAVIYLVIFGSIVGYTAFVLAMSQLPVAVVSIYMYVNPVVAVLLGWLIFAEKIGWREIASMTVIFTGSAMVKYFSKRPSASVAPPPEPRQSWVER